eukprot:1158903-Pelagomonas_calceolata.AAC.10
MAPYTSVHVLRHASANHACLMHSSAWSSHAPQRMVISCTAAHGLREDCISRPLEQHAHRLTVLHTHQSIPKSAFRSVDVNCRVPSQLA